MNCMDVYATEKTLEKSKVLGERNTHILEYKKMVTIGDFQVLTIKTIHDCEGSSGFVVYEKLTDEYLLFVTDSKFIPQRFNFPFSIIMIEASYCGETLKRKVESGEINESLAKRLLDSHMEINETLRYLEEFCDLSKCHELHLLHISGQNNDRERCRDRFEKHFMIDTVIV